MSDSDLHGRIVALEVRESQRHQDMVDLRDAVRELSRGVSELNKWQASMRTPLMLLGVFVFAAISAAGAWAWNLLLKIGGEG
jgi:hypothetical protein